MNLFRVPAELPQEEIFQTLWTGKNVRVEKIVSAGQCSAPGFWYDQADDEWVALLQGEASIAWEDGRISLLSAGDWLFIPARAKHRVEKTSSDPMCIWLAIHISSKS